MTTRYQVYSSHALALVLPERDHALGWRVSVDAEFRAVFALTPLNLVRYQGLLFDVPFHTDFAGGIEVSTVNRARLEVSVGYQHLWDDGYILTSWRTHRLRTPGGDLITAPPAPFSSISSVPRGTVTVG